MLSFRAFLVSPSGALRSPFAAHLWTREGNRAACQLNSNLNRSDLRARDDNTPCADPPQRACACGFSAYPSLEVMARLSSFVNPHYLIGLVSAYGRVIEHTDSVVRSEYVTVLALTHFLLTPEGYSGQPWQHHERDVGPTPERTALAAGLLGVPYANVSTMREAAAFLDREAVKYDEPTLAALSRIP